VARSVAAVRAAARGRGDGVAAGRRRLPGRACRPGVPAARRRAAGGPRGPRRRHPRQRRARRPAEQGRQGGPARVGGRRGAWPRGCAADAGGRRGCAGRAAARVPRAGGRGPAWGAPQGGGAWGSGAQGPSLALLLCAGGVLFCAGARALRSAACHSSRERRPQRRASGARAARKPVRPARIGLG